MTSREVYISLTNISIRMKNDLHIQAKLHGAEFKDEEKEKVEFTKTNDVALQKAMDRINKERFERGD